MSRRRSFRELPSHTGGEETTQEDSIQPRLRALSGDLKRLQGAYDHGYEVWRTAGDSLKSPVYDQRRSGKPGSRTPTEAEGMVRVRLVLCAQRLASALRILALHDLLTSPAWHPSSLARQWVILRDPWVEVPVCDDLGNVEWRDASDVTLEPVDISPAVSQLRAAVVNLDCDEDVALDFLHEAEEAVRHVKKAGVWALPVQDAPPKVCARQGCWNEVRDGTICRACVQRDYRERKKAS